MELQSRAAALPVAVNGEIPRPGSGPARQPFAPGRNRRGRIPGSALELPQLRCRAREERGIDRARLGGPDERERRALLVAVEQRPRADEVPGRAELELLAIRAALVAVLDPVQEVRLVEAPEQE